MLILFMKYAFIRQNMTNELGLNTFLGKCYSESTYCNLAHGGNFGKCLRMSANHGLLSLNIWSVQKVLYKVIYKYLKI